MRTVSESEVPALLQGIHEGTVLIQKDGQEIAYLVSPDEFRSVFGKLRTQRLLEASDALSAEIARNVQEKGLSLEDLMKSLDRKSF